MALHQRQKQYIVFYEIKADRKVTTHYTRLLAGSSKLAIQHIRKCVKNKLKHNAFHCRTKYQEITSDMVYDDNIAGEYRR